MPIGSNDKWNRHDCYCGKKGCIETFLSGPGFSKHYFDMHNIKLDAKMHDATDALGIAICHHFHNKNIRMIHAA